MLLKSELIFFQLAPASVDLYNPLFSFPVLTALPAASILAYRILGLDGAAVIPILPSVLAGKPL